MKVAACGGHWGRKITETKSELPPTPLLPQPTIVRVTSFIIKKYNFISYDTLFKHILLCIWDMNVALEVAGFQYNHLATLLEQPLYATRQMEGQFSSPHTNCREEGGGGSEAHW